MTTPSERFHWADYVVFSASILLSLGIGIYFAIQDKRRKRVTSAEFLMAGRNAQVLPVSFSILASFISAIFIIGIPPEIMVNGTMFCLVGVGYLMAAMVCCHTIIPLIHKLQLTSAYEYLELRFNKVVRMIGSGIFLLMMLFYMAVVLYTPADAFAAVTGLSTWITIFGLGVVCAIYTSHGGMRAVLWTDTFQLVVILVGLITLAIKGSQQVGGINHVMDMAHKGGRIQFDEISFDPRVRHTVWGVIIGSIFLVLSLGGSNQIVMQRYMAIPKLRGAQIAMYLAVIGAIIIVVTLTIIGLVMYAYYDCNPLLLQRKPAELVPLFMMHVLGELHGLPGLFSASVFAAALSTISSVVQGLSAVAIQDLVTPAYQHFKKTNISDRHLTYIAKGLALAFGLLTVGLSYVTPFLGPYVIQLSLSILGTMGGPLLALFILAIWFPCVNSWGAGVSAVVGLVVSMWLNIGAILLPVKAKPLPFRVEGCPAAVLQALAAQANGTTTTGPTSGGLSDFYKISYMLYPCVGVIVAVVLGPIVSALTGFEKKRQSLEERGLVFRYPKLCGGHRGQNIVGIQEHKIKKDEEPGKDYQPVINGGFVTSEDSVIKRTSF